MSRVFSSSKALAKLLSSRSRSFELGNGARLLRRCCEKGRVLDRYSSVRCSSSLARFGCNLLGDSICSRKVVVPAVGNSLHSVLSHTRSFLGCGDGFENNALSKKYEERRVLGYSPEQVYGVVAAVDLYEDFVPWCQRSKIIRRNADGSFDAELEIGFKLLVESYVSHVQLEKSKYVKTTASQSNLFDHLINVWEFNPGPVPGACDVYFMVDFKFNSPLYRQVASIFFNEVVSRLVTSFTDRCCTIYGPATPVLETSYGQKT